MMAEDTVISPRYAQLANLLIRLLTTLCFAEKLAATD